MSTLKEYFEAWGEDCPTDQTELSDAARWIRNSALKESDWTQFPDVPLSSEAKLLWAGYRSELRDLDFANINPDTFNFPAKPQ